MEEGPEGEASGRNSSANQQPPHRAAGGLGVREPHPLCAYHLKKLSFPAGLLTPVCRCAPGVAGYDFASKMPGVGFN